MKIASRQSWGKIASDKQNKSGGWQKQQDDKTRVATNQVAVSRSNMVIGIVGHNVSQQ